MHEIENNLRTEYYHILVNGTGSFTYWDIMNIYNYDIKGYALWQRVTSNPNYVYCYGEASGAMASWVRFTFGFEFIVCGSSSAEALTVIQVESTGLYLGATPPFKLSGQSGGAVYMYMYREEINLETNEIKYKKPYNIYEVYPEGWNPSSINLVRKDWSPIDFELNPGYKYRFYAFVQVGIWASLLGYSTIEYCADNYLSINTID